MARTSLAKAPEYSLNILLVEDNSSDAYMVNNLMNFAGGNYTVTHVENQSQAIETLKKSEFDVCLLDLSLPDASGFSALIDIQEKAPTMPVLILTGTNDKALAKRAVSRGAQDYLLKDDLEGSGLFRAIDYAIERKRIEMELFLRANFDTLTGIANRDMFINRLELSLERLKRSGSGIAVLFVDLDKFKPVNDKYGHDAGDEALKITAQRLRNVMRSYDTPARFGGDEFAVLLEGVGKPHNAANIAQKIITELCAPMHHGSSSFSLGASIGIVFVNPSEESVATETILQHADLAMYHAKKDGGNNYRFYVENLHEEASARISLEEDLKTAIIAGELQLYYQPYLSVADDRLIGVEALLRWKHPERGLLCAEEFLQSAESCHIMPDITQVACVQLCRDIAMWNAYSLPPLVISLNLSAAQLDAKNLIPSLLTIAKSDFLGEHRLAAEIPEQAIAQISGARFMTLAKLSEMGIELHIDHFGRNILPLTTLCELPFSLLKIDGLLIKDMSRRQSENISIAAATSLAHQLGMKIGAVGVEEEWQHDALKSYSCDGMQGFIANNAMSAEQFMGWVKKSRV